MDQFTPDDGVAALLEELDGGRCRLEDPTGRVQGDGARLDDGPTVGHRIFVRVIGEHVRHHADGIGQIHDREPSGVRHVGEPDLGVADAVLPGPFERVDHGSEVRRIEVGRVVSGPEREMGELFRSFSGEEGPIVHQMEERAGQSVHEVGQGLDGVGAACFHTGPSVARSPGRRT